MPLPPSEPPFDRILLARFLTEAGCAKNVGVSDFALLSGGAIQENWGFSARFIGGPLDGDHDLVLRTDAATGVPSSLSRLEEFAVVDAAYRAGICVPQPLWACTDTEVIGKPFFVMRRVTGTPQGRQITSDPRLEPHLPDIAARLGRELAKIQTIRPGHRGLDFLPFIGPAEHIAAFRAYLDRHQRPRPVLEWAIRWLETHMPQALPAVLCHRDFRTGNYLVDGAEPTAILDWEFAGWGDPDEDIGWFCCKGWRFARLDREAGGIAGRAPFYKGYESVSGRRLDPERVRFWEVLANVRWAVIALQQSDRHLIGGARDLSTAIIGRRATECDLELLMLLDPEGAPSVTPSPPSGERVGVRGQASDRRCGPGPVAGPHPPLADRERSPLSRDAGEGFSVRDLPEGDGLLSLARELLLQELLPLLPPERAREARLVATAMAIAEREAVAGDAPDREIAELLAEFYAAPAGGRDACSSAEIGPSLAAPLGRLARDLRIGAFEPCEARARAARALLWQSIMVKLREGNPAFLAANGFGE